VQCEPAYQMINKTKSIYLGLGIHNAHSTMMADDIRDQLMDSVPLIYPILSFPLAGPVQQISNAIYYIIMGRD